VQELAEVCIKRPVFATMLIMAFVVVGGASWMRLGVDRFPAVDLPTVSVRVELLGASTEETETQVAQKLEEQINTIQGSMSSARSPAPAPSSSSSRST
jgi:HAE1 family hydrophobic/amphiphilic exporter-1